MAKMGRPKSDVRSKIKIVIIRMSGGVHCGVLRDYSEKHQQTMYLETLKEASWTYYIRLVIKVYFC